MTPSASPSPTPSPVAGFKAGAAQRPVPLEGGRCLGGYDLFCSRRAEAERDPLTADAFALSDGEGNALVLVKTTNVGWFVAYKPEFGPTGIYDVRQRIARRITEAGLGTVSATQVILTADHSHHAPDTIGIWGGVTPAFMAAMAQAAEDAAFEAWENREPAQLRVAVIEGPPTAGSYSAPPTNEPDRDFRVLFAEREDGTHIAALVNYSPHATVLSSGNTEATGDWTAWASQEVNALFGGVGIGLVGALGAMDWNKSGSNSQREAEARERLRSLLQAAHAAAEPVRGQGLDVQTRFVREPLGQPILALNYLPPIGFDEQSVAINRSVFPPWNTGAVVGTYVTGARIGDVFLATYPGEPFPQLHYPLRDGLNAQAVLTLGAAQDFLGYMVRTLEQYQQTLENGLLYLAGCPERALLEALNIPFDGACPDHWTLMVSPFIGRHLLCSLQDTAERLGFDVAASSRDPDCPLLTVFDGLLPPPEYPQTPLAPTPDLPGTLGALDAALTSLAERCSGSAAPTELCLGLQAVRANLVGTLAGGSESLGEGCRRLGLPGALCERLGRP